MITDEQKKEIKKRIQKIRNEKHLEKFEKFMADNIDKYGYYDEPNLEKYKDIKKYTEE